MDRIVEYRLVRIAHRGARVLRSLQQGLQHLEGLLSRISDAKRPRNDRRQNGPYPTKEDLPPRSHRQHLPRAKPRPIRKQPWTKRVEIQQLARHPRSGSSSHCRAGRTCYLRRISTPRTSAPSTGNTDPPAVQRFPDYWRGLPSTATSTAAARRRALPSRRWISSSMLAPVNLSSRSPRRTPRRADRRAQFTDLFGDQPQREVNVLVRRPAGSVPHRDTGRRTRRRHSKSSSGHRFRGFEVRVCSGGVTRTQPRSAILAPT